MQDKGSRNLYIVGIDIGTSGTKAVALAINGDILSTSYHSYEPVATIPEHHELDPQVLYDAVFTSINDITNALAGKNYDMEAISFSSAMHSLLLTDVDGKPLTNLITWADLRSKDQAATLKASAEGPDIYRLSGTPIHPMTPLCKLIWFREHEPELFERAAHYVSIKEFVIFNLIGKWLIDHSIASATGLFDIYKLHWNQAALKLGQIPETKLSSPVPTIHREDVRLKTQSGVELQTQIVMGASDGCLANLGSNAVRPGDVSLTIGTSGAVRMVTEAPKYDPKARIFNYVLAPELFVSGGPINNGGVLLKWYSENFLTNEVDEPGDFETFIEIAGKVEPGCNGLIFLPYVQGERAPVWDAEAKGVFFGVRAVHTQAHFMRAIIEGICFSLLDVSLSLEETLGAIKNVYASGGFVKSPAWVQMLSDILGKKIHITDTADASSIGAAMLGLYAMGHVKEVADTTKSLTIQNTYTPDSTATQVYKRNFEIYRNLYSKLKDDFHKDL